MTKQQTTDVKIISRSELPTMPTIRYRIELYTDANLQWFAEIQTFTEATPGPSVQWTATTETYTEALRLAEERIKSDRKPMTLKEIIEKARGGPAPTPLHAFA